MAARLRCVAMFFAHANVFERQAAECVAHSRLTASHFSHLGCSLLRCPVHCRRMASSASLFMQVAVHLHNQHALLLRVASSRRQQHSLIRKRCKRHNGWVIKPRQVDPSALRVEEKWWHDSSRSPYWHYFKDDASFNEHSFSGVAFYDDREGGHIEAQQGARAMSQGSRRGAPAVCDRTSSRGHARYSCMPESPVDSCASYLSHPHSCPLRPFCHHPHTLTNVSMDNTCRLLRAPQLAQTAPASRGWQGAPAPAFDAFLAFLTARFTSFPFCCPSQDWSRTDLMASSLWVPDGAVPFHPVPMCIT